MVDYLGENLIMTATFNRWKSTQKTSRAFQVFRHHQIQLSKFIWSHAMSAKYTYSKLGEENLECGKAKANWEDSPAKHFKSDKKNKLRTSHFRDMKDWSKSFDEFENCLNLSALLSLCSYLELYIDSIVSLSIQSDPGLLYQVPQKIDGIYVLKYGNYPTGYINDYVTQCTKGEWSQRFANYEKIFTDLPADLKQEESNLEKMRNLRNKVAHSFGKDIQDSHDKTTLKSKSAERLRRETLFKYMNSAFNAAKAIDAHLLDKHIGEYELIYFYHVIQKDNKASTIKEKAHFLKKRLGFTKSLSGQNEIGLMPYMSKQFCIELVGYYEEI